MNFALHMITMKKIFVVSLFSVVLSGMIASQALAIAPLPTDRDPIPTGITTAAGFIDALEILTDWLFVILVVISVIFIILAGLQFITGGGDPAAVSMARTKLIWAAVGIGVALLSRGLPAAVQNLIGA